MNTNADITLYSRQVDAVTHKATYVRHIIQDISWYASMRISVSSDGVVGSDTYRIRIPPEAMVDGMPALQSFYLASEQAAMPSTGSGWTVKAGDYFCRGIGPEIEKPSELEAASLIFGRVCSWGDNRRGSLPHIRIEGW